MRWMIGLLVVVNLVLLLWQFQVERPEALRASATLPEVGELRLLSRTEGASGQGGAQESEPAGPPAETGAAVADAPPVEEPIVEEPAVEQPAVEEPVPEKPELEQSLTEQPANETSGSEASVTSMHSMADVEVVIEDQAAAAPEASATTSKPLLSAAGAEADESRVSPPDEVAEKTPRPAAEESGPAAQIQPVQTIQAKPRMTPQSPAPRCWRLSSFDTQQEAEAVAAQLPAGVKKLRVEPVSQRQPSGYYYVLLPPLPDRAAALRLERRLKEKGIKDSWVFSKGPLRNAISLGLYSSEVNARRHQKEIEAKGFEPELRPRFRTHKKFALLLTGPANEATGRALEVLSAGTLEIIPCPE